MREIELSQGYVATVDDVDYGLVSSLRWHVDGRIPWLYAVSSQWRGRVVNIPMHRFILGLVDKKILVDHKDGNGLNNCRDNLRICTHAQNMANRRIQKNNSTGFRGVHVNKTAYVAAIKYDGKDHYLGRFKDPNMAAKIYDEAARIHHGRFARLNFQEEI